MCPPVCSFSTLTATPPLCWPPVLSVEPNWAAFFTGENLTFTCDLKEGKDQVWYCKLMKDHQEYFYYTTHRVFFLRLTPDMAGQYWCEGSSWVNPGVISTNAVALTVSGKSVVCR